jgi:hypothetical protein
MMELLHGGSGANGALSNWHPLSHEEMSVFSCDDVVGQTILKFGAVVKKLLLQSDAGHQI